MRYQVMGSLPFQELDGRSRCFKKLHGRIKLRSSDSTMVPRKPQLSSCQQRRASSFPRGNFSSIKHRGQNNVHLIGEHNLPLQSLLSNFQDWHIFSVTLHESNHQQ